MIYKNEYMRSDYLKFVKCLFLIGASVLTFSTQGNTTTTVHASKPKITNVKVINKLSSKLVELNENSISKNEFYEVKNGDTLSSIAKRSNVDVKKLMELNKMNIATLALEPGEKIRLMSKGDYDKEQADVKSQQQSSAAQASSASNASASQSSTSSSQPQPSSTQASVSSQAPTSQQSANTEQVKSTVAQVATPTVNTASTWSGAKLTASMGVNTNCPQAAKESYYNMNMAGVVANAKSRGLQGDYSVRADGVKTFGNYVIVAASYNNYKYGQLVDTSLGKGIVLDTGTFAATNPNQFDLAVNW